MPRYDYRCVDCEQEFELVQSFSDAGSGVCPACSGAGRRLFHAVPVIYRGSGFYTTDYGRPKIRGENGAKESSDTKATSGEGVASSEGSKVTPSEGSSGGSASKSEPAVEKAGDTKPSA